MKKNEPLRSCANLDLCSNEDFLNAKETYESSIENFHIDIGTERFGPGAKKFVRGIKQKLKDVPTEMVKVEKGLVSLGFQKIVQKN